MATSWLAFAERCARAPAKVEARMPGLAMAAAEAAVVVQRGVLNRAAHGQRLRGVGQHGARVDVVAQPGLTPGSAIVRAKGPLHLLERENKPHTIAPRRYRAMRIGDRYVSGQVHHPGTRARHPFEEGFVAAAPVVRRVIGNGVTKAIGEALG